MNLSIDSFEANDRESISVSSSSMPHFSLTPRKCTRTIIQNAIDLSLNVRSPRGDQL